MFERRKTYPYVSLELRLNFWLYARSPFADQTNCCSEDHPIQNKGFAVELMSLDEGILVQMLIEKDLDSRLDFLSEVKSCFNPLKQNNYILPNIFLK